MNALTKLIGNNWISFNPNTKLFSIDLLYDEGSGFLLDLKDPNDIIEFNNLINYIIRGNTLEDSFELENTTSTLTLMWIGNHLKVFHSKVENTLGILVDMLKYEDADEFLEMLKRINSLLED